MSKFYKRGGGPEFFSLTYLTRRQQVPKGEKLLEVSERSFRRFSQLIVDAKIEEQ